LPQLKYISVSSSHFISHVPSLLFPAQNRRLLSPIEMALKGGDWAIVKPRKHPTPKTKPEGMMEVEWDIVLVQRNDRGDASSLP
jgi:hypothetical protein